MRVTIIADDDGVYVNGQCFPVDCTPLRADGIHAVQFDEDHGWIEFKSEYLPDEGRSHREPNKIITDIAEFQSYVDAWSDCKRRADQEQAASQSKKGKRK
jgi:hypothetical protein